MEPSAAWPASSASPSRCRLIFFWLRGALTRDLKFKLVGLLALGGLQGFVGWWMVSSGLVNRIEVAQERLAIHLLLASITFAATVWIASSLSPSSASSLGAVAAQLFAGAIVARDPVADFSRRACRRSARGARL